MTPLAPLSSLRDFPRAVVAAVAGLPDLVFPPRCLACREWRGGAGDPLCPSCRRALSLSPGPLCAGCGTAPAENSCSFCPPCGEGFHRDGLLFLGPFEGVLRDLVHAFKYRADFGAGAFLAGLLAERVARDPEVEWDLVLPVPLHPRRLRTRGFNQAALLGGRTAAAAGGLFDPRVLKRTVETRPLAGLDLRRRRRQVKGVMDVARGAAVGGRRILIVDDVVTSGATVEECCRVLKEKGASLTVVAALARAPAPR